MHARARTCTTIHDNTPTLGGPCAPVLFPKGITSPIVWPARALLLLRQELISAMTYSKAPEFVRMIQLMLGSAAFDRALHRYHTKFAYSNARTSDW